MRRPYPWSCLVALGVCLSPKLVLADATPPKVCVVVAGDADVATQNAALRLDEAVAARLDYRAVADAEARAALRGEPRTEAPFASLVSMRRGLTAQDTDTTALDALGDRLGCAIAIEVAARPTGFMVRSFDLVHHTARAPLDVQSVESTTLDRVLAAPETHATGTDANTLHADVPARSPGVTAASPSATATVPPAHDSRPPAAADPRVSLRPSERPASSSGPGVLGWCIAGGAAAALIAVFIVVQSSAGSGATTIDVMHSETGARP